MESEVQKELARLKRDNEALKNALKVVLTPYDSSGRFGGDSYGYSREAVVNAQKLLKLLK